jgi:hypothetical protein
MVNFLEFLIYLLMFFTSPLPLSSLIYLNKPELLLAGEGSVSERGWRPSPQATPLKTIQLTYI